MTPCRLELPGRSRMTSETLAPGSVLPNVGFSSALRVWPWRVVVLASFVFGLVRVWEPAPIAARYLERSPLQQRLGAKLPACSRGQKQFVRDPRDPL